jgi:hypothetical protein
LLHLRVSNIVRAMVETRWDRERRGLRLRWTFVATLGVACAGRSITETRDASGGTGGSYSPAAGGSGATVGFAAGGTTVGVGGGVVVTPGGGTGGAGGVGGDGGGVGPFPRGGVGGGGDFSGTSGDAGAPFEVGGSSGSAGRVGFGGASGKAGGGGVSGRAGGGGAGIVDGGDGGDAGAPPNEYWCKYPLSWQNSAVVCSDGFIHRPVTVACPILTRDHPELGAAGDTGAGGSSPFGECVSDQDCAADSYCLTVRDAARDCTATTNVCVRGCSIDADCGQASICLCNVHQKAANGGLVNFGTCVDADCRTDADCEQGYLCRANTHGGVCQDGTSVFACQSFLDECGSDTDCDAGWRCAFQDGSYVCTY